MSEQGQNKRSTRDLEEARHLDDKFIPDDALPLCPKCLKPCHPLQHYCDSCDSNDVINPLTPYMAFLNIRFNYGIFCTMWQKIWYEQDFSIIFKLLCLLLIALFAPIMLVVGLPLLLIGKGPPLQETSTVALLIAAIALLITVLFLMFSGLPVSTPLVP